MYGRESGESSGRKSCKLPISKLPNTVHCNSPVAAKAEDSENDDLDDDFNTRKGKGYLHHHPPKTLQLPLLQILIQNQGTKREYL